MQVKPYSDDAERALLGSMIHHRDACDCLSFITESDFYTPRNAAVFSAIKSLVDDGKPVDALTVADATPGNDKNIKPYILDLLGAVPTHHHWKRYADIVLDKARKRSLIDLGMEMQNVGFDDGDAGEVMERAESIVTSLRRSTGRTATLDAIFSGLDLSTRVESFTSDILPGCFMQRGQLVLIGARPSVGKSAIAGQIADELASRHVRTRIWSYEMNSEQYARRMLQHRTGFGMVKQVQGLEDYQVEFAKREMSGDWMRFVSLDDSNPSLTTLCHQLHKAARDGVDVAIIDHLHILVDGSDRRAVTDASRRLKLAANDARLPGDKRMVVILLAQFSRLETRDDGTFRPPTMQSFKESGSIEADADIAVLLHNYSDKDAKIRSSLADRGYLIAEFDSTRRLGHIEVGKNRYGKLGHYPAWFDGDEQRWSLINQTEDGRPA